MAARRLFWKWHCWKSIGFFPYPQVMCQWSLDLIFEAKLKLESGNWKIQYDHQAAILEVTSLKINRLLAIATNNMHMKFEIEIPRQTWVTLRKPCRLQMDGQTDMQTDRHADRLTCRQTCRQTDRRTRWIQYNPHQLHWRGYNDKSVEWHAVTETNDRPLTNVSAFWAAWMENWPGQVKFCIEHIMPICFWASAQHPK